MSGGCLSPASRIRIAADVHRHSTSDDDSGCMLEEYSWVPSGIKPDMVHMYFACLPEDKIPYVNSAGEEWRTRQLYYQLPPQDSDVGYCGKLSNQEVRELIQFEVGRKRECLGRGIIEQLPYDNKRRHCHKHGADVYCGRHHAEQIKPRCAKCDELIFSEECTEAEGRTWHMAHFSCSDCGVQLGGQRYIGRNDRMICISCYNENPSLVCNTCEKEIVVDEPHIIQNDIHWHADERCFCCSDCGKNLLGKRYSFRDEKLYCVTDANCGKWYSKVTFNSKVMSVSSRRRGSVPEPPSRDPPSPPAENIYETVLPCFSREWDDINGIEHLRGSCSSSESDSDDVYLLNYLAASLSQFNRTTGTVQSNRSCNRIQTAKNKSSSNCIVS
ncbi:Uncharacterized protein BM_BM7466 [Brugia malayi]|uniref:BMA-PRKL-1, isoform b; BMA-PRKL-1, isoform i n=1 Tax=Brugia malayi TaxID=6279 RepID=A0A4E9ERT0_BRUMA|nr:Uncharacterized protein BM_BM7466 [Brugia malayi]VIO86891.1 Uncharacterized protein BM_BM7466 [Brugia malayi]